jgi:hypothetical protein
MVCEGTARSKLHMMAHLEQHSFSRLQSSTDLQGLEAAFEGMQSPHRPPTAHQGAVDAPVAQPKDGDSHVGDQQGGRQMLVQNTYTSPKKLTQLYNCPPVHPDSLPVSSSTPVMGLQPSQVRHDPIVCWVLFLLH